MSNQLTKKLEVLYKLTTASLKNAKGQNMSKNRFNAQAAMLKVLKTQILAVTIPIIN